MSNVGEANNNTNFYPEELQALLEKAGTMLESELKNVDAATLSNIATILNSSIEDIKLKTESSGSIINELDLPALKPSQSCISLDVMLNALNFESRRTAIKGTVESMEAKSEEQNNINAKQLDEIKKRLEKMRANGILDIFKKIFSVIATVISAIASIATIAAGVMTGNPLLIAGGAILATMTVNNIVTQATGGKHGIAAWVGELAKKCGASDEAAGIIGMVFETAIMIVGVALTMGGAAASSAANAADKVASTFEKLASTVSRVTNLASGVTNLASGAINIGSAVVKNQAEQSKARQKELEALLLLIKESYENDKKMVEAEMKKINELMGMVSDIVKSCKQTSDVIVAGAPEMA